MSQTVVTENTIQQVSEKLDFAIKRLDEMMAFCERSRDEESSPYIEQSHFVLGVVGHVLDDAAQALGNTRTGAFDNHPAINTLGVKS